MRRIFITGIGTDVGKTIVSAILTEALEADYWKPVQSGSLEGTDSEKVKELISNNKTKIHAETYLLREPLSPHAAAALENIDINPGKIILPETNNNIVVEGAGGLMVPLNKNCFVIDLIPKFKAEALLVVKHYLGSINHTLLSIDALKTRNINICGIVINGKENKASEEVILNYYQFPFIGRVGELSLLNKQSIKDASKVFKGL